MRYKEPRLAMLTVDIGHGSDHEDLLKGGPVQEELANGVMRQGGHRPVG